MSADEAFYHMQQMQTRIGGTINEDDQRSVFELHRPYARSIVWETKQFTLIADLLQYRRKGRVYDAVVGMSLHPKMADGMDAATWFQNTVPRYGVPTFSSKVGPDRENSLYFCRTTDGRSCEGAFPMLIVGHNYVLLSDCGYIDRMSDPDTLASIR